MGFSNLERQVVEDAYKGADTKLRLYLKVPVMGTPCQTASTPQCYLHMTGTRQIPHWAAEATSLSDH